MIGGRDTNEPADPSVPELELHPADRHVQTLEELLEDRQGLMLYHHLPNEPSGRRHLNRGSRARRAERPSGRRRSERRRVLCRWSHRTAGATPRQPVQVPRRGSSPRAGSSRVRSWSRSKARVYSRVRGVSGRRPPGRRQRERFISCACGAIVGDTPGAAISRGSSARVRRDRRVLRAPRLFRPLGARSCPLRV